MEDDKEWGARSDYVGYCSRCELYDQRDSECWVTIVQGFVEGRYDVIVQVDEGYSMVWKAIYKDGEQLSGPREKASSFHLVDRDAPSGDEVCYTNTSVCW